MEKTETLDMFYRDKFNQTSGNLEKDKVHFNILSYDDCADGATITYRRRDFYKVTLARGNYVIHYGDKSLAVSGSTLAFFSPDVPYTIEMPESQLIGDYFIFREAYFNEYYRTGIRSLPVFAAGNQPVYSLNKSQDKAAAALFKKMRNEMATDYVFKHDLIRNGIVELIHFALKLQPAGIPYPHTDANVRITAVFTELLDRQFPIEAPQQRFELRSARDFAAQLNVHVNHLNHALKSTTGKTTTGHISARLTNEAIALLKHTDWNISEISYCLGFEDQAHFTHFFKKQTSQAPSHFRG